MRKSARGKTTEYSLRLATRADIRTLAHLRGLYCSEEGYPFSESTTRRALAALIEDPSLGLLFLIFKQDEVVGYAVTTFGFSLEYGGRGAVIDELYVIPSMRGQGAGTYALKGIEATCRSRGIIAIFLEVEHGNDRARQLYLQHGFVEELRHLMVKALRTNDRAA